MTDKRKKRVVRLVVVLAIVFVWIGACVGFLFWSAVYKNNVTLKPDEKGYLYVPTGSDYNDLLQAVDASGYLKNMKTFKWLAQRKNLPAHVYPGRYEIIPGMNNNQLIDMLRSGAQTPLNVTFSYVRTLPQLAGIIARQLEPDSATLLHEMLSENNYPVNDGFNTETFQAMYIPNTYEFYWNTTAGKFVERMKKEYKKFWNAQRLQKAKAEKLTPVEVSVLASIIDRETVMDDEKPRIAGVYLNRLHKGWKLQADPTVVYAFYLQNDSLLNRVYKKHTQIQSPYNTYLHKGLPPGPICIPSIAGIDAVLNAESHKYMYFVAKPDGSGYHHFSKTYKQHKNYARQLHRELNKRKKQQNLSTQ